MGEKSFPERVSLAGGFKDFEAVYPEIRVTTVTYYKWSKAFLESGKNGLTLDTKRSATSDEVKFLKSEVDALKRAVAEQVLENQRLKKSLGL